MNTLFQRLAPAMVLGLPLLALAQTGRVDPAEAKASAPPLRYQSAFADYKPWQDAKPGDWRAVNDKVRDAGVNARDHSPCGAPSA